MTLYQLAERFVGEIVERPGASDHPFIVWCHESCGREDAPDEIPWCSAFLNRLAWLLRLPRSKSAAARSWLTVGVPIALAEARVGSDVVILQRGVGIQPGPEVTSGASGHVGLFAGSDGAWVLILGGNQANGVTIARYRVASVLGVRRLSV